MPGLAVVVNPHAAGNRRPRERARRLAALVDAVGWVRETETVAALANVAAECRAREPELVAVCGGDGSFSRAVAAIVGAYGTAPLPAFLPLRGGTMNTIARAVGAPRGRPETVIGAVAARLRDGEAVAASSRDLLRINGDDYGFMLGVGVVVAFLEAYYVSRVAGPAGAMTLLGRLVVSLAGHGHLVRDLFTTRPATVACDGRPVPFAAYALIYAATIDQIGLGFRPAYRANQEPGRFHFLAGPIGPREFLACLPGIWRGRPTGSAALFDATARRVEVEFPRPSSYMVDGDVRAPVPRLQIETGPRVRLIRE